MLVTSLKLPKRGPFKVSLIFAPSMLVGWPLFGCIIGGFAWGMLWLGNETRRDISHVQRVWSQGVVHYGSTSLEGIQQTRKLFVQIYSLELTYRIKSGELTAPVSFIRFGSGPNDGDSYETRVLNDAPTQVAISWQKEAIPHMRGLMWLAYTLALVTGYLAFRIFKYAFGRVLGVYSLAGRGRLMAVPVVSSRNINDAWAEVTLSMARGKRLRRRYRPRAMPLPFIDNRLLVVLGSADGKRAQLIADNGYPLVIPFE